jgi:hypothetical protein
VLNTSTKLDWNVHVAPVVTNYMVRMKQAVHGEKYRKKILTGALGIYDKMVDENMSGTRPLHRPMAQQVEERRRRKQKKKHSWSARGGYIAPIFIPAKTGSELMKLVREVGA